VDIKKLTPALSVAGQIAAADLPEIAGAGFRSIICNRTDGEAADQPGFSEIERAARSAGLEVRYLPAESGKVSDEQGAEFGRMMEELPRPVLAYCRSGMRSATMWALSQSGQDSRCRRSSRRAREAGYDLKAVWCAAS
jgi:sulfide:quinone oxidoreductase